MTVLNDSKYLQKRLADDEEVPPGRIRLAQSLVALLEEKEFTAISAAEIAKHAGVTDALIYKYYKDKRGLFQEANDNFAGLLSVDMFRCTPITIRKDDPPD